MTKRIALLLASGLVAFNAFAAAPAHESRSYGIITDPMYLPEASRIYGQVGFDYLTWDVPTNTGTVQTGTTEYRESEITARGLYGVTEQIIAGASIDYAPSLSQQDRPLTGLVPPAINSKGFHDPVFEGTYRLLETAPTVVDAFVNVQPSLFASKVGAVGNDGTVATGQGHGILGIRGGVVERQYTVAGTLEFDHGFAGKDQQTSDNTTNAIASNNNFLVRADGRAQVSNEFSVNLAAQASVLGDNTYTNSGALGTVSTLKGHINMSVGPTLNYQFVPDQWAGSLGYQATFYPQYDTTTTTSGSLVPTTTSNSSYVQHQFRVALTAVF